MTSNHIPINYPAMIYSYSEEQSPSTSSTSDVVGDECLVCSTAAHGVHFGVSACRACAAFFRRTVVMGKTYKCRGNEHSCTINKNQRYLCRYCRYTKCLKVGMKTDNVQWNRDLLSTNESLSKIAPKRIVSPSNDYDVNSNEAANKLTENLPALFDLSSVMSQLITVFSNFKEPTNCPAYHTMSTLSKMNWALSHHRRNQQRGDKIHFTSNLRLEDMVHIGAEHMTGISEWMMHAEEFRLFSIEEKFSVFKLVWHVLQRLERITMSIEIFGQRMYDEKIWVASNDCAILMDHVDVDLSEITDISSDQMKNMFHKVCMRMYDDVAKPLLDLEPKTIEVTYMLCHVFWYLAGKNLQGKVLEASERFIDEIGNNLHDYYKNEARLSNYAARLIKLMNVVNALQKIHWERQKIVELAKIFNVFKAKLSEPDLLEG